MNMTLNRHQELRFVVAPTSIMYHSFSCDNNFMYRQNTLKFYSDVQKMIILVCTK